MNLDVAIDAFFSFELVFGPDRIVHDFCDALFHLVDDFQLSRADLYFVINNNIDLAIEFLGLNQTRKTSKK